MAIEIVDFPMKKLVDLSMAKCKRSPEGTFTLLRSARLHTCIVVLTHIIIIIRKYGCMSRRLNAHCLHDYITTRAMNIRLILSLHTA